MKTFSGFILCNILGWKLIGDFPNIKKSIVIFAPHTSFYDGLFGKLAVNEIGIHYKFLSKKELFFFPLNLLMNLYGSISVKSEQNRNSIYEIANKIIKANELHLILSPEGTRKKVTKWNKGFYYMAIKSDIPIVVAYLDYKKKEVGIKGIIEKGETLKNTMVKINFFYEKVNAKYPENFSLDLQYLNQYNVIDNFGMK